MEMKRLELIIERKELFELLYDLRALYVEGHPIDIRRYETELQEEIDIISLEIDNL